MFSLIVGAENCYVAGGDGNSIDDGPICRRHIRARGDWEVIQETRYRAIRGIGLQDCQTVSCWSQ